MLINIYLVDNKSAIWIVCILVIRKIKQKCFRSIFEYKLIQIMHSVEFKKIVCLSTLVNCEITTLLKAERG